MKAESDPILPSLHESIGSLIRSLFLYFFVHYFIAGSVATVDQAATLLPFVSVVNLV